MGAGASAPERLIATAPEISDRGVAAAFAAFPTEVRGEMLALRDLIFDVASGIPEVGPLEETLKWGQPAYLTSTTKAGTTIRLGLPKQGGFALYTHCQSTVMSDMQANFPGAFTFEGNRGVLFTAGAAVPEAPLRVLIRSALTYHLNKKR